jgi:hypothetical protein
MSIYARFLATDRKKPRTNVKQSEVFSINGLIYAFFLTFLLFVTLLFYTAPNPSPRPDHSAFLSQEEPVITQKSTQDIREDAAGIISADNTATAATTTPSAQNGFRQPDTINEKEALRQKETPPISDNFLSQISQSNIESTESLIQDAIKEAEMLLESLAGNNIDQIPPLPATQQPNGEKLLIPVTVLNEAVREAIVNILCTTKTGGAFRPISGSGVVIDPRGIVLTTAHIAQYFLLKDYLVENFVSCAIRVGSPAKPRYRPELLYISPRWVKDNSSSITAQNPQGTGEHDFALLRIAGPISASANPPTSFHFIRPELSDGKIKINNSVLLVGYPAGFLGGQSIQTNLYLTSTVTQITRLFTFTTGSLDSFSIGSSIVAQKGSSGGAVVSQNTGNLIGIIVTSTDGSTTADRDLRAISTSHINRSLLEETGLDLPSMLAGDPEELARLFNQDTALGLTQILLKELGEQKF